MLPAGFEPTSPARKAGMIGRSTLWEHGLWGGDAEVLFKVDTRLMSMIIRFLE